MPRYAYSAYADTGRLVKGDIDAESDTRALDVLVGRGLTPVSVEPGNKALPWWARDISFGKQNGRIKTKELETFFTSFASMLNAEFPLLKSIGFCRDQTRDPLLHRSLNSLHDAVSDGHSLQNAMQQTGNAFPERIISLTGLGETSNTLPEVARRIAQNLASEAAIRRELRGALIYPIILLTMSALVMSLIVFYLVPTLTPVFASANTELPTALKVMSVIREGILTGWPILLGGTAALLLLTLLFWNAIAQSLGQIMTRAPVLGSYLRQRETLRICQVLHVMLASGAPVQRALSACVASDLSPPYSKLIQQTEETVLAGGTLSKTLANSPLIDPMARALIEAGEEADRLVEVLETLVSDLTVSNQRTLKQTMQLLTPILTLFIGLSVGALILSTITAIMDLNDIAF